MDRTPKAKSRKLSCKPVKCDTKEDDEDPSSPILIPANLSQTSTPTQQSKLLPQIDDYSPVYMLSTQESQDDIDVIWDWNSPQTKHHSRFVRKQKRLLLPQSPKVPMKKHPSNNQIQTFNEIKEQMEALKQTILNSKDLDETDTELNGACESFHLDIDNNGDNNCNSKNPVQKEDIGFDNLFEDDFMEEQLLLCSQEIESKFQQNMAQRNLGSLLTCDANEFYNEPKKSMFKFKPISLDCNKNLNNFVGISSNINSRINIPSTSYSNSGPSYSNLGPSSSNSGPSYNAQSNSSAINTPLYNNKVLPQKIPINKIFPNINTTTTNNQSNVNVPELNLKESRSAITNLKYEDKCLADDSFEQALAEFDDEDIELLTQAECLPSKSAESYSSNDHSGNSSKENELLTKYLGRNYNTSSSTGGILSASNKSNNIRDSENVMVSKNTLDEIEKKRLQALAKLEAKRKHLICSTKQETFVECETSPIKCSPEEIEQKRLQAIAKREAKMKQEIIEKNRLEALKRLEMNKRKRTLKPNCSLPRRTDYSS